MPKLDLDAIGQTNATGYPPPYAEPMAARWYRRLSPAAGLEDFGASHVVLKPGGISSQRHWHEGEDELLVMIAGEAVLVEEARETVLGPGDVAAFPKGVADGHHLVNRGAADCVFLAIGKPVQSPCHYPDIDMHFDGAAARYTRKDGSPY
ncbi:MAG TPA: cupin domain-containing protein [Allosphingosinicella sp.]|jgi:uncharacterized cupin superfamily protein